MSKRHRIVKINYVRSDMLQITKSLIWDLDCIYSLMASRNCPTCTPTSEICGTLNIYVYGVPMYNCTSIPIDTEVNNLLISGKMFFY